MSNSSHSTVNPATGSSNESALWSSPWSVSQSSGFTDPWMGTTPPRYCNQLEYYEEFRYPELPITAGQQYLSPQSPSPSIQVAARHNLFKKQVHFDSPANCVAFLILYIQAQKSDVVSQNLKRRCEGSQEENYPIKRHCLTSELAHVTVRFMERVVDLAFQDMEALRLQQEVEKLVDTYFPLR